MASTRSPKPLLEAYSLDEFAVVVDRADVRYVGTDPEDRARNLITGKKGCGPHCKECSMKPAGMTTVRIAGDCASSNTTSVSGVGPPSQASDATYTRTPTATTTPECPQSGTSFLCWHRCGTTPIVQTPTPRKRHARRTPTKSHY